jgi:hypothetical protein
VAATRYRKATATIRFNNIAGISWLTLLILSIVVFFLIPGFRKGLKFWLPSVVFLGPVALILRLFTGKRSGNNLWTDSVIETAGDVVPLVPGTLLAMIIVITSMLSGQSSQIIQILFLIIPLISSWIFFHGIMLSGASGTRYGKFLQRRLPHVLITLFLGCSGIFMVSIPFVNNKLTMSQIMPLSPWIVMTWWAVIVAGSIAGSLFIYFYELWSVRRGSAGWIVLTDNSDEVKSLKLRKIWWWIPVSLTVLITGMIIAVKLLQNTSSG